MELSVESQCQLVTWKVHDVFQLPSKIGYSLDSPEFRFADDKYRLRLYPNGKERRKKRVGTEIWLERLTSTFPERNVSFKCGFRWIDGKEEFDTYLSFSSINSFMFLPRFEIEENGVMCFLDDDDTFTLLCCLRLREQSSGGSPQSEEAKTSDKKEEQDGLPEQSVFFSSCWKSSKMELSTESPYQHVTWKIPAEADFIHLPSKMGNSLSSPEFRFADDRYCLRFYYQEVDENGDADDTYLQLVRLTSILTESIVLCKIGFRLGLKDEESDTYIYTDVLTEDSKFYFSRRDLDEQRLSRTEDDEIFPDGAFTVVYSMRLEDWFNATNRQSDELDTSDEEEKHGGLPDLDEQRLSRTEDDEIFPDGALTVVCSMRLGDRSSTTDRQSDELDTSDAEEKHGGLPGVAKLQSDYRQLLQKGVQSDAFFVVSGKEFRAHRCVLRSRSTVFEAMFRHETAEKESGRVVIDDLDPESFGKFLEYLYTGAVRPSLSDDNACGLYAAADKYNVPTLKSECVAHMRRTLSVDSFCDVITLALRHHEEDLLQQAIAFFKENLQRILVTVKWQQFVIDNGTSANELLIKAFVSGGQ